MNSSRSNHIDALEMAALLQRADMPHLLDVREAIEYHTYNIGGINIPLAQLPKALNKLDWNKNDEIIVICKVGLRSETAQAILNQYGYANVRNLTGGIMALQKLK
mgnify:CR=1 FL=1